MSIERLFSDYPANHFLEYLIRSETEFEKGVKVSALAKLFIRKGRDGLQELDRHTGERTLDKLNPQESATYHQNAAAILWGALFPVLETLIVDGVYEPKILIANQEAGFMGVRWKPTLTVPSEESQIITAEQRREIVAVASRDKSLIGFLYPPGISTLPSDLSTSIINSGLLPDLANYIGPEFRKRALILNPPSNKSAA